MDSSTASAGGGVVANMAGGTNCAGRRQDHRQDNPPVAEESMENGSSGCNSRVECMSRERSSSSLGVNLSRAARCAAYPLYRGVSRTNTQELIRQSEQLSKS